jgi:cytochrome c oxidase cbb3-type subunit 3
VKKYDPYTGHRLTGHEWNGITELNTAVPWVVWAFLIAAVAFAVAWWILMPAWPIGTTYTKGVLGADVRHEVAASLKTANQARAVWTDRIKTESFAAIQADPALMRDVRETGHALFGDNCAACHGETAKGNAIEGAPDLTDHAWLWGGSGDAILKTIDVGINSTNPDSRMSQMPAWGSGGLLKEPDITNVVAYVTSLSHTPAEVGATPEALAAGHKVFADNCAACHGDTAKGNPEMGAPDLTDGFWLHGGDQASIYASVYNGRQGLMPSWTARLSDVERKILALYVLDMGRGAP